jgi:hypothetical protein
MHLAHARPRLLACRTTGRSPSPVTQGRLFVIMPFGIRSTSDGEPGSGVSPLQP